MTTIACDGKSMAGDTLCTANGSVVAYHRKIERLSDGRIVGSCGDATQCILIRQWLEAGRDKPELDDKVEAIVLNLDGTIDWWDKRFVPLRYIAPMAIGSGGDYAIGAMLAGQDPVGAVEIAMIRDRNTGGDVETYSLEPTLKAVA